MKCNKRLKYNNYVAFSHFHGTAVNNSGLVYKITESWKSYSSSDCSDLYKLDCQLAGIITFIIDLLLIISYITNINLFSYFGLD